MSESDKKPSANEGSSKRRWNNSNKKKRYTAGAITKSASRQEKFTGGKDELEGNYFDCTGYGQSDRFVKTVQKIADYIGQEYKVGGITRTEVMTQTAVVIPAPTRPTSTSVTAADGTITTRVPDALDISDYQSEKKTTD